MRGAFRAFETATRMSVFADSASATNRLSAGSRCSCWRIVLLLGILHADALMGGSVLAELLGEGGTDDVKGRREQEPERGHAEHPREHRRSERLTELGPAPLAIEIGKVPSTKAKLVIKIAPGACAAYYGLNHSNTAHYIPDFTMASVFVTL
jgi:hypothetical protein